MTKRIKEKNIESKRKKATHAISAKRVKTRQKSDNAFFSWRLFIARPEAVISVYGHTVFSLYVISHVSTVVLQSCNHI